MATRIEHFDGNEIDVILRKVVDLEERVKADGSYRWDTHDDPDVDHRLAKQVVRQMMKRGYPVKEEPLGTVTISRKK